MNRHFPVALVLAACHTGELPAPGLAVVRDSAGITIVENASRAAAPEIFHFDPKPLFDVGGLKSEPGEELVANQGYLYAAMLSNGNLAVIDVNRIHFYDGTGTLIRTVGQQGAGPEDFDYLTAICRTRGDTLVVSDSHNHRIAIIDPGGRVITTLPGSISIGLPFEGCFDDGSFVAGTLAFDPKTMTGQVSYDRLSLQGIPLNAMTITSAEERRRYVDRQMQQVRATTWPVYGAMHLDRRGRLWVQDFRLLPTQPNAWTAFDPQGWILGKLVLPDTAGTVLAFGDGTVLLRRRDDEGAEHLAIHAIRQ